MKMWWKCPNLLWHPPLCLQKVTMATVWPSGGRNSVWQRSLCFVALAAQKQPVGVGSKASRPTAHNTFDFHSALKRNRELRNFSLSDASHVLGLLTTDQLLQICQLCICFSSHCWGFCISLEPQTKNEMQQCHTSAT